MMVSFESLKERCISIIVENFEKYYAVFEVSEGSAFEKQFKYLKRVFAETLFRRLMDSGKLKPKYFKLLINRHVRCLDLEYLEEDELFYLVHQLRVIDTSKIVFLKPPCYDHSYDSWGSEYHDYPCYKQLISLVPNVEVIEVRGIHREVLEEIGKRCPLLRVLKVYDRVVKDDELKKIFMSVNGGYEVKVNLEQLDIRGTAVTHIGVSFVLSHAPSLNCLKYSNVPGALYEKHRDDLYNNSIEALNKYSLTSLSITCTQENMLDALKICAALCPNISSLSVITGLENDEQLVFCSQFHHLKDVKIKLEENPFSWESIAQFLKLRGSGLLSLQLEDGCISAEDIIEFCPKLHSLKLVNSKPLNPTRHLFAKAKLPCLKKLTIINAEFFVQETADSVELILSNSKNITSVDFSGAEGLTENFFQRMLQLDLLQLEELDLSASDVTVSPLVKLLSHGNLQKLIIPSCSDITEEEYFDLLACIGDNNNVTITWEGDDEDETESSFYNENDVRDFSDDEDSHCGFYYNYFHY